MSVAKAYSGLTDEEIEKVDRYVRKISGKFGPVRSVRPGLVFEIAFEESVSQVGTNQSSLTIPQNK